MNKYILLTFGLTSMLQAKDMSHLTYQKDIVPILDNYCYKCHDSLDEKGGIDFELFEDDPQIAQNIEIWKKAIEQVHTGEMPTKKPFPTEAERQILVDWLDYQLKNIDWNKYKNAGNVNIPRLTKEEYRYTIQDLFAWDYDASKKFNEDAIGESGFNNDRDGLFLSATQMDKYFVAAEDLVNKYFPSKKVKPLSMSKKANTLFNTDESTKSDDLGYFIYRDQDTLYYYQTIETSGVYELSIDAHGYRPNNTTMVAIKVLVDNQLIGSTWLKSRNEFSGDYKILLYLEEGNRQISFNAIPSKVPQELAKASPTGDIYQPKQMYPKPTLGSVAMRISELKIEGPLYKYPEGSLLASTMPTRGRGKSPKVDKSKTKKAAKEKSVKDKNISDVAVVAATDTSGSAAPVLNPKKGPGGVEWIHRAQYLKLPDKPDYAKLNIAKPSTNVSPRQAAEIIVKNLASRAYRRPVKDLELSKLLQIYDSEYKLRKSYIEGLKGAFIAVLVSPQFLYRIESSREGLQKMGDYKLASRLSYFLWMSLPDDELMNLASKGKLSDPQVMESQLKRMLQDPKAKRFTSLFSSQWLTLTSLGRSRTPDAKKYKQFTPELMDDMVAETENFISAILIENKSILDILDSDYTYMNEDLAKFYKVKGVVGDEFRRVQIKDKNRGGVLGMAAVLTATSQPLRTSPVDRGLWVLERLLGKHLPEPPANIPPLPEGAGVGKAKLTLRQELEKHRDDPNCRSCHDKIDPIGFGLENFDPIGNYRKKNGKNTIDSNGVLPSGEAFSNPHELRKILVKRKASFARTFSERMLSFALGRQLQYFDEPVIMKLTETLLENDMKPQPMLLEIIKSYPFTHKESEELKEDKNLVKSFK
ncbi:DUF1592 domain-containing protein [Lentisphaera profundi]|uniref:DUF1592 domain-containing protein n=1 Tax=Lentisphaera profundi TaxID=1658616 RepID=A0ABY7VVM4_9BACT|nr:DUF1592 domain-containing protein [Lentisphaera profundi]WDE97762.1 DUF1592 domain-containing protein [Lentisphaera profundi]